MNVFDLMAKISLDKSEYSQGMSEASSEGEKASSKIGGALGKAGKVAGASLVAMGTAVAGVTKVTVDGMKETASYGDIIDKTSQKLGVSAKTYQEYDYVMQLAGTTMQDMGVGLKTLTNQVGKATEGSKESADMFKKLGISMDDLKEMSREDVFKATIAGLQGMEDSTDRARLAQELFGKSGQNLTPLFNMSNEETQKLIGNLNDMGGVMSDQAVKASADFQDAITTLGVSVKGLKNGAFAQLLPASTDILNGLTKLFSGDSSGMGLITKGVNNLSTELISALPKLATFGTELMTTLLDVIVKNLPKLLDSGVMIVMKLGDAIIQNLPAILTAGLEVILKLAQGIAQSLPELIPTIVDVILQMVDALISNVDLMVDASIALMIGLANGLVQAMPTLVEKAPILIENLVKAFIQNVPKLLQACYEMVKTLGSGLVTYFPQLLAKIPPLIKNIVEKFKAGFTDFKTVGKNIVDGIWEGLSAGWTWLKDKAKELAKGLLDSAKEALGIHSPSREFKKIGEYCVEGFNEGISDLMEAEVISGNIKKGLSSIDVNTNLRTFGTNETSYNAQPIYITLQGDAGRLFRLVQQESSRNIQLVGG